MNGLTLAAETSLLQINAFTSYNYYVSFTENFTYTKNNTTINAKFLYFSCVALKGQKGPEDKLID